MRRFLHWVMISLALSALAVTAAGTPDDLDDYYYNTGIRTRRHAVHYTASRTGLTESSTNHEVVLRQADSGRIVRTEQQTNSTSAAYAAGPAQVGSRQPEASDVVASSQSSGYVPSQPSSPQSSVENAGSTGFSAPCVQTAQAPSSGAGVSDIPQKLETSDTAPTGNTLASEVTSFGCRSALAAIDFQDYLGLLAGSTLYRVGSTTWNNLQSRTGSGGTTQVTPEPSAMAGLLCGFVGLTGIVARRRKWDRQRGSLRGVNVFTPEFIISTSALGENSIKGVRSRDEGLDARN